MREHEVTRYLRETRAVEGWFFPMDAHLFAAADEFQKAAGIAGNLFEIGVHHGKTAIFLALMAAEGETVGVCDVFGDQALNVDRSGEGSRELFLRNMRSFAGLDESRLRVFAQASETLTVEETTPRCRFFHVDGGHRPQTVVADLRTADRALLAGGIVAVDDVFNPSWPGVGEGLYRFFLEQPEAFAPVAIGGNKVLLARPRRAVDYRAAFRELVALPGFSMGEKEWMGRTVVVAERRNWVDLDPIGAAALHLAPESARDRIRAWILRLLARRR